MKIVEKPWGREVWWAETEFYVGKILEVNAGESLSRQYHREKTETMLFYSGTGQLLLGESEQAIGPGTAITILPGTIHRITATSDLIIFEVSTPQTGDVVRLADRYGRERGEAKEEA